jgi:hypothetical protein
MKSDQIGELATALAKAQGEMKPASKDGVNPAYKRDGKGSKYATLDNIWDACRLPLSRNGLSVSQALVEGDKGFKVITTLMHTSGQWITSDCPIIMQKNDMQGLGSAYTYAKRYSLAGLIGVVDSEDDDAEGSLVRDDSDRQQRIMQSVENFQNYNQQPITSAPAKSGAFCESCGQELILSPKNKYYCKNWKDEALGKHTIFPAEQLEQWKSSHGDVK